MGLFDRIAIGTVSLLPNWLMWRLASRYIAGEKLGDAIDRLKELEKRGYTGILDLLGEEVEDEADARAVVSCYSEAAKALSEADLDVYVSVKPTHVGLRISEDLCHAMFLELADTCAKRGRFLRVEMEDHTTTDATLRVFERLRTECDHVGIVLQSRLLRTTNDIDGLASGALSVRMVKGIYIEPESIAHVEADSIRDAYVANCRQLLERGAFVSFATHDRLMARRLLHLVDELGVGPDRFEFQVLLGVQAPLWEEWRSAGHAVRVYVPYGPEWRAYSTRRLNKNPQIFRHVARDLVRFG